MASLRLPGHDVIGVRADNPGRLTLSGTNTWILGRNPAWLIDPGPALEAHLDAIDAAVEKRGGLGGIALTHDHADHAQAVRDVQERHPGAVVAGARGHVDVLLDDGDTFGPLRALSVPGHAPDHLVLLAGSIAFTGDAVLGEGSVFIAPDPGALAGYLDGLRRLQALRPEVLCPGHGPVVEDPQARLAGYIAHRLDRERRLLGALAAGRRGVDELLDSVWSDAPAELRPVAALTLAAHLDKLEDEGRLPGGVERPRGWPPDGSG